MRGYHQIINEGTGRTDPRELGLIEDCMRHTIFHSTLGWLSREQLHKGAREAVEVLVILGEMK
jgi:hypothetical protein